MRRFKLGRRPRLFNSRVMHLSSILAARDIAPPPPSVDWTKGIDSWGMMLNDTLGDCTCAAAYHARQVWSVNSTNSEETEKNDEVLSLYEAACGYNPADASTDQGGDEQTVLTYLLNHGYFVEDPTVPTKILAFFEVDPRNENDIKTVINECGVCYIGFDVPENVDETPGSTWELDPTASIEGGHAVILVGYDAETVTLISWGAIYRMTWDFFAHYTDEAYAIIDPTWCADGKTPLGLTSEQLEAMMSGLK